MNIASQIRHLLTFLAGLGGLLLGINLLGPDQVPEVNAAGEKLIDPLAVILGAVAVFVSRAAIAWFASTFRVASGEKNQGSGGGSGRALLLLFCCTVAGLGFLPSCSPLRGVPINIGIEGNGFAGTYSAKGLQIRAIIPTK